MGSYPLDASPLAEDNGSDLSEPTQTLHEILNQSVCQYPERTAIVSCYQPWNRLHSLGLPQNEKGADYLRLSYAQLDNASKILASYLTGRGVGKGNVMAVILPSGVEWGLCFWAAARLGCPFVPIIRLL